MGIVVVNVGADAGQTIGHTHVRVIPRYPGDVPDPRGGVRSIIPGKAKYWKRLSVIQRTVRARSPGHPDRPSWPDRGSRGDR